MTLRSVPDPTPISRGDERLAEARKLRALQLDPDERDLAGGYDRHTLADTQARQDYLLGTVIELRTKAECDRYGVRPKPSEREAIQERIAAEEWDAACQFEHMSDEVDRRRSLGRRGVR